MLKRMFKGTKGKAASNESHNQGEVSLDTAYIELYNEMRRLRDYQLASSRWYSTILLAISGALLAIKTPFRGSTSTGVMQLMDKIEFQLVIAFVIFVIGASGLFVTYYTHRAYKDLRKWTSENLEPEIKQEINVSRIGYLQPHHAMYATQSCITVLGLVIVFI